MEILYKFKSDSIKYVRILGIKIYEKEYLPLDNEKTKYLYGLLKIRKDRFYKKIYILGIQIFSSKNVLELALCKLRKSVDEIVINETRMANAICTLHSKVFPPFKNINKSKDVVIIGTGPTLNYYEPIKNGIHIGLNRAFQFKKIHFDYIFAVDYAAVYNYITELKNYECVKFFGMHCNPNLQLINPRTYKACHIPENVVEETNALRFYSDAFRKRINYNIEVFPLMDRGSIAFPALHFALYTRPKKIYLAGCDTNKDGYFDKRYDNLHDNRNWVLLDMALQGYKDFKTFVDIYYPDTEIISVNPVGLRGLFRDVYTRKYVSENPDLFQDTENIEYLEDIEVVYEK